MPSTIANETLTFYIRFEEGDVKADREKGRLDGEKGYPSEDQLEPGGYELEIIGHARASLAKYMAGSEYALSRIEEDIKKRSVERDDQYIDRKNKLTAEKENKLQTLSGAEGPQSQAIRDLRRDFDEKKRRADDLELRLGRPLRSQYAMFYGPIMLILALIEIPVNRLAFEFFFQENPVLSLAIAFAVGALFMLLAHFSGTWIRQYGQSETLIAKCRTVVAVFFVLVLVACAIYFISIMRQEFVDFLNRERSVNITDMLKRGAVTQIINRAMTFSLGEGGVVLMLINILIFCVGTIFSYAKHDPHPDYEGLVRRRDRAQRRLSRSEERFRARWNAIASEYDDKTSFLHRQAERLDQEIRDCERDKQTILANRSNEIELVRRVAWQRIAAYQTANIEERSGRAPRFFGKRGIYKMLLQSNS